MVEPHIPANCHTWSQHRQPRSRVPSVSISSPLFPLSPLCVQEGRKQPDSRKPWARERSTSTLRNFLESLLPLSQSLSGARRRPAWHPAFMSICSYRLPALKACEASTLDRSIQQKATALAGTLALPSAHQLSGRLPLAGTVRKNAPSYLCPNFTQGVCLCLNDTGIVSRTGAN